MSGFPTLLFRSGDKGVIAHGHRTFETYRRGIEQLLGPERLAEFPPRDALTFLAEHGPLTIRELAEVHNQPSEAMRAKMETLAAQAVPKSRPRAAANSGRWRGTTCSLRSRPSPRRFTPEIFTLLLTDV